MVAVSGEELEEVARHSNTRAEELDFLLEREGSMYRRYRARVAQLREAGPRRKRSRWGAQEEGGPDMGAPGVAQPLHLGGPGASSGQWSQQELEVNARYTELAAKQTRSQEQAGQGKIRVPQRRGHRGRDVGAQGEEGGDGGEAGEGGGGGRPPPRPPRPPPPSRAAR